MLQFILTDILMISLGAILYLVARSLPRVGEEAAAKQNIFERWASSELPEKFDAAFNNFLIKFLRKLKLLLLKADNSLTKHLKKIAPNGNGGSSGKRFDGLAKPKIDFKDISNSESGVEKNPETGDN